MTINSSTLDIDELFIDITTLPRARKKDTGVMVTSKKEVMDKFRSHWLHISLPRSKEIFDILEQVNGASYSSEKNSSTTLLINPRWVEYLIALVNETIQNTWDDSEVSINTSSRQYQKRNQQTQLHLQWQ